jgi:Fe2+ or Zn2+ uptake regulation protein
MNPPAVLAATYRARGRKLTPQRQLIFSLLHNNTTHPTAEALYATASHKMPGISLRTVYQTLNELADMGELQAIDLGEGVTRFDPNVDDHHHAICNVCGAISDVHVERAATLRPKGVDGFNVDDIGVVFRGVCASCETPSKRSPSPQVKKSKSASTPHPKH